MIKYAVWKIMHSKSKRPCALTQSLFVFTSGEKRPEQRRNYVKNILPVFIPPVKVGPERRMSKG
ncbi:MAG: hypothetical protein A2010_07895 [Nitrospirae bacterium GWD2_57_9]|nr:MAG: hypothetical protein A2010_07895 [Nitrospirae bacterium GWD2_57_9]